MDKSLSKGLMKQFFRRMEGNNKLFLSEIGTGFSSVKKFNYKSWKKIIGNLKNSKNNLTLHSCEFGSKRRPRFGFMTLEEGNFNPIKKFDEKLLYAQRNILQSDPPYLHETGLNFTISHHVVSRMFERNKNLRWDHFDSSMQIIKQEFELVPIFALAWSIITRSLKTSAVTLSDGSQDLSVLVPTKCGLLFGRVDHQGCLMVRTFVDDANLTEEQAKIKKGLLKKIDPYKYLHLPYLAGKQQLNDNESTMTSIFLDMLVRDLKSEILESIPTMLSKSLSMAAEKKYRQHISDVLDDMICYQGPAYDQMSEGFDAIRMSLLQLNNFDDYLDFTRQISLFIKRA